MKDIGARFRSVRSKMPAREARLRETTARRDGDGLLLEPQTVPGAEFKSRFERTVDEGERRLGRTWPGLIATGTVGGVDLGAGLLALLLVKHETGSTLLAALAFSFGFIALTLAGSELFTENFLVPIAAVVARKGTVGQLLRLWSGTAAFNLLGGWILMGLVLASFPHLAATAVEGATHFTGLGIGWRSFATGILGGTVMTLMTWMERGTESVAGRLAAAVGAAFLLAAGPLNHAIVSSLEMFAALHAGAPFGYADWLGATSWAALANSVGGIGLVTVLRLIQVGRHGVEHERRRPYGETRAGDGVGKGSL